MPKELNGLSDWVLSIGSQRGKIPTNVRKVFKVIKVNCLPL